MITADQQLQLSKLTQATGYSAPPQTNNAWAAFDKLTGNQANPVNTAVAGHPFNPLNSNNQFIDPNKPVAGTTTASKFMGSLVPAVGQLGVNLAQKTGQGYMDMTQNLGQDFQNLNTHSQQQVQNDLSGGNYMPVAKMGADVLSMGAHAIEGVFSPLTALFQTSAQGSADAINQIPGFSNNVASFDNSPGGQKVNDLVNRANEKVAQLEQQNPTKAKAIKDAVTVTLALLGEGATNKTGAAVSDMAKTGSDFVKTGIPKIGSALEQAGIKTGDMAGQVGAKVGDMAGKVADVPKSGFTKLQNAVTPMDESVRTELTKPGIKPYQAAANVTKYSDAAKAAMADNSKPTPMELAGQKGEEALGNMNQQIKTLGQQKSALVGAIGEKPVGNIVEDARASIRSQLAERTGTTLDENGKITNSGGRESQISNSSDVSLLKQVDSKLASTQKAPTFQKVDDAIRFIQNKLYERTGVGAIPVNSQVEGILKSTIGELNGKLKDLGGSTYADLNSKLSDLLDTRTDLNKGLGADANKGAALMKSLFSPNGTMARGLFGKIQELTGVDLTHEATIAKWAMENSGDVRQASLLKQVINGGSSVLSKTGFTKMLIDNTVGKVIQALQNPEGKATSVIKDNLENYKPSSLEETAPIRKGSAPVPKSTAAAADLGQKSMSPLIKVNNYQNNFPKYFTPDQIEIATKTLKALGQQGHTIDMKSVNEVVKQVKQMSDIKLNPGVKNGAWQRNVIVKPR